MKKLRLKTLILSVVICLLPMVAGAFFYGKLPLQMAIHWDVNNIPDNYMHKALVMFGLPVVFACVQTVTCFLVWQSNKKAVVTPKIIVVALWSMPLILIMVYTLMLLWASGQTFNIGSIGCVAVGIVFILLGNYFPKISYGDSKIFLSTPNLWSEQSFRKTMRILSIVLIFVGVTFFVLALL